MLPFLISPLPSLFYWQPAIFDFNLFDLDSAIGQETTVNLNHSSLLRDPSELDGSMASHEGLILGRRSASYGERWYNKSIKGDYI